MGFYKAANKQCETNDYEITQSFASIFIDTTQTQVVDNHHKTLKIKCFHQHKNGFLIDFGIYTWYNCSISYTTKNGDSYMK